MALGTKLLSHPPNAMESNIHKLDLEQERVPVWVKLSKISLELMTNQGISCITSGLGVPTYLEEKGKQAFKASTAGVCIDITIQEDLPSTITIILDQGLTTEVEIDYPWGVKDGKEDNQKVGF